MSRNLDRRAARRIIEAAVNARLQRVHLLRLNAGGNQRLAAELAGRPDFVHRFAVLRPVRGRLLGLCVRNCRIRQMAGVVAAQLGVNILRAEADGRLCLRHVYGLLVRCRLQHIPTQARWLGQLVEKLRILAKCAHGNILAGGIEAAHKAARQPALIAIGE